MSPMIFLLVAHWVMRMPLDCSVVLQWSFSQKLDDLDFAGDINLLSYAQRGMQAETNYLWAYAQLVGLKINTQQETPTLSGPDIESVQYFTYQVQQVGQTLKSK